MKNLKEKQLRNISSLIGFCFILEILLANFLYIFLSYKNYFEQNKTLIEIFINLLSFTLPYVLLIFILKKKISDVVPIKRPKNNYIWYIGLGLGLESLIAILTEIIVQTLKTRNLNSQTPKELFEFDKSLSGIILYLISLSVIPALVEEFMCRGVFLGLLRPYGTKFAIFISSLLFGLMHGNIEQCISAFLIGLYMAFLVVKTESLWPAIFLHFFNNLIKGIFVVFNDLNNEKFVMAYYNILLIISIVSFMFIFMNNKGKVFSIDNKNNINIPILKKFIIFIFTPGMILFFVYVGIIFFNSFKQ